MLRDVKKCHYCSVLILGVKHLFNFILTVLNNKYNRQGNFIVLIKCNNGTLFSREIRFESIYDFLTSYRRTNFHQFFSLIAIL